MVMVTLGTGVGGGIIIGGKLYTGCNGIAGELGHMVDPAGTASACGCGREGLPGGVCLGGELCEIRGARAGGGAREPAAGACRAPERQDDLRRGGRGRRARLRAV